MLLIFVLFTKFENNIKNNILVKIGGKINIIYFFFLFFSSNQAQHNRIINKIYCINYIIICAYNTKNVLSMFRSCRGMNISMLSIYFVLSFKRLI